MCIDRLNQAKGAIVKLVKTGSETMTKLKAIGKPVADSMVSSLEAKLQQLHNDVHALDSMLLFQQKPDNSKASLDEAALSS